MGRPMVVLWISSGRSWLLLTFGLGFWCCKQKLMTMGQHFSVADMTHYVRVAINSAQVITKLFSFWAA